MGISIEGGEREEKQYTIIPLVCCERDSISNNHHYITWLVLKVWYLKGENKTHIPRVKQ